MRATTFLFGILIAAGMAIAGALQACASDTGGGCFMVDAGDGGTMCEPIVNPASGPSGGGW